MSESLFPTFRKISQTPLRDILRLRITGRLDWKSQMAVAGLPAPVLDLISQVVKRTRLWRLEKAAVTDELIAHFIDGSAAGASSDEMVERFGDPQLAAKLIRRSKRRGRPLLWHIWNMSFRIVEVLIGLYAILFIRFYVGRPTPSVDYIAKLNAPILKTPVEDRAWPLWRQAIIAASDGRDKQGYRTFADASQPSNGIDEIAHKTRGDWLSAHATAIRLARQAGIKPAMGFVLGVGGSVQDTAVFPAFVQQEVPMPMIAVLLPHLNYLRSFANILSLDAKFAAQSGNQQQFEADFMAILGLSKQLHSADGILLTQLAGLGVGSLAVTRLQETLVNQPAVLSDDQLIRFAHAIAGPEVAADMVTLNGERDFFADTVQRLYTDDGHGNGHMTLQGLKFFAELYPGPNGYNDYTVKDTAFAVAATLPLAVASRAESLELYDRLLDQSLADLQKPIREVDLAKITSQISDMRKSTTQAMRYAVVLRLCPSLTALQATCERYVGTRDGAEVAISLELFHRRHDCYPASPAELTPELLPAIPTDRITGGPIKYRLIDGKPVVYSVGVDRIDDGGARPMRMPYSQSEPAQWQKFTVVPKGDWVLYPPDPADDQ